MKFNESTAVSTPQVLLVPYDLRHVLQYHAWMEDPAIQEATASERLTLEEEYENQESWRASHDKLTFIICQPPMIRGGDAASVVAGEVDTPGRMVGDVNFFLYPYDEEDGEEADDSGKRPIAPAPRLCVGEVDVMIADAKDRGRGLGRATVSAFLQYILRNLGGILAEYRLDGRDEVPHAPAPDREVALKLLMAKIKADNSGSLALFKSLGFQQEGDVNYFGEVKLVLHDLNIIREMLPDGYSEFIYHRPEPNSDATQRLSS